MISYDLLDKDNAALQIVKDEEGSFFKHLSKLDIEMRWDDAPIEFPHSELLIAFKNFIQKQTLDFTDEEKERMYGVLLSVNKMLSIFKIEFHPSHINFIKTTGKDEMNAGYTRNNSVIISQKKFRQKNDQQLLDFITHELFHVYSRHNPEIKLRLYQLIGFKPQPNAILEPRLKACKITNPDASNFRFSIALKNLDGEIEEHVPLVYNRNGQKELSEGEVVFGQIRFAYFPIIDEVIRNENALCIKRINGNYERLVEGETGEMKYAHQLYDIIGINSGYIIHPEEIMADNFSLLMHAAIHPEIKNELGSKELNLQNSILELLQ